MEAPGAGPSLDELLAERYERLSDFINVDRLNLFAAVSLLNARYLATGPTDQEVANDSVPVLEWASTVGMQRAAEVLLVGLWSALESFVEDVFVLVCMHRSFWLRTVAQRPSSSRGVHDAHRRRAMARGLGEGGDCWED